ncbi:hypothetical protein Pla52n_65830 [Stieleria varia]|uniref:Uncharacterized protein n=1 Tax=Stieleria varia TaxID=2528005 RepID=A0A5C5ZVB6_9BACT|nr:hypothetical protein Pla52n_65830 [Stieleria varia]
MRNGLPFGHGLNDKINGPLGPVSAQVLLCFAAGMAKRNGKAPDGSRAHSLAFVCLTKIICMRSSR